MDKTLIFLSLVFLLALGKQASGAEDKEERMSGSKPVTPEQHRYTNRLAHEKSPYLLQHAHNPVDWYPWGKEAFAKAKKEDKPIFLSIGYSTCHWCHVMEEESFEDPQTAQFLNEHFVPIKVDREERPDVDQIYMAAVMAMTGSGGWPLSVFLTPDLKPFYGGTYFPNSDRYGMPSFMTLLRSLSESWKANRAGLVNAGENLTQAIRQQSQREAGGSARLDADVLKRAHEQLRGNFDSDLGGFGGAPKFPRSHLLSFLLRYWKRSGDAEALGMVTKTLDEMAKGGMYDQLGGGFHRYSVDERWHVPHFEKMLYDQALLAKTYLEATQATGNAEYARVAREIFDYVFREMTSAEGPFYCAQDADSVPDAKRPRDKKEGAVYVWEQAEIEILLGKENAEIFDYAYGVESHGNAQSDPHGEFTNKNILFAAHGEAQIAKRFSKKPEEVRDILRNAREKLMAVRAQRPSPHLDDKMLTDWNGLFISSLAMGSMVLEESRYRDAAKKAADFILARLVDKDGRLLHRYRDGEAGIPATLEDHAFLAHGLFDLFEATQEPKYLDQAKHWTQEMIRLFWDEKAGGFFLSAHDAESLITRSKEVYDGAIPSGNSVAALALLRVGRLTMDSKLEEQGSKVLKAFSREIDNAPSAYPQMLIALDFALGPVKEIVIAGDVQEAGTKDMLREIYKRFLPNAVVVVNPATPGPVKSAIEALMPFVAKQNPIAGKPTAYVCQNYACSAPTNDKANLIKLLEK